MATDIERLTVLMEANTKQFANSIKKIERDVDKTFRGGSRGVRQFDLSMSKAASSARVLAGAFGVGFVAGGLTTLPATLRQITAEASKVVDVARKVGLTTDALQELRFAGEQTGVAVGQMDTAMEQFSRRVAEAAAGTGELKDVLRANNVALRDQDGKLRPQAELLGEYANLIRGAASDQDKLRLAILAFGRAGGDMVNTLSDGKAGLDGLRQSARDAGAVMREDLLKAAKDVDDRFAALTATIGTKVKSAAIIGITAIEDYAKEMGSLENAVVQLVQNPSWRQFANVMLGKELVNAVAGLGTFTSNAGAKADKLPVGTGPKTPPTVVPTKTDEAAAKAAERRAEAIKRVIDNLKFEAEQLGRTAAQQEVYNAVRAAGTTIDTAAGRQIAALVTQLQDQARALDAVIRASEFFQDSIGSGLETLILDGAKASDVINNLAKDLARAALQASLLGKGPLAGLFGSGQSGGLLGSLFSAAGFGGARAGGGPVAAGKSYLVGERGPELFQPSVGGRIVPNGAGGGGTVVTVVNNSGGEVSERRSRGPDGSERVDILIDRAVARNLGDPGSDTGKAFAAQSGGFRTRRR